MDHRYGLPDLTQLMAGKTHLPTIPQGSDHLYTHRNPPVPPPLYEFGDMNNSSSCGLEREGFNNEMSRWGRQETLTLLEVRSLLHHTFKDAAVPKAPLWDQVSRIMREEHGYHRSGKKCKEKFENLYKYYKKTKECKNGRQDGKTYRFFRQLEALCGESSNNPSNSETLNQETNLFSPDSKIQQNFHINKIPESLSLLNSDEFDTSSSEKNGTFDISATGYSLKKEKKTVYKNRLKKIENLIESRMEVLMERQEAWMEKMMNIIEYEGRIRVNKEKEWRKQEATRFDQEYEILANERAFNEARDTELMESLQIFAKNEVRAKEIEAGTHKMFEQSEISSLMQIRTSMETKFQEFGCFSDSLWEEVASKMGVLGYDFCARKCKETWDTMSVYYNGQDFVKQAS